MQEDITLQEYFSLSHLKLKKVLLSFNEALGFVKDCVNNDRKEIIVTLNTEMFVDSLNDNDFKDIINNSCVVLDSVGICYLFNKKTGLKVNVLNGIELAERIMEEGYRVFILGSKQENIEKAVQNLKDKGFNIVGFHNGFFSNDLDVIDKINVTQAQILLVGMGSPKQEKWLFKNKDILKFNIGIGIGGSIDVWAGIFKRAPILFRKAKLEWLYRTLTDFKRFPRLYKLLKFAVLAKMGRF
jgi:N-acetylglucosaminyldiphosphoundecaprenol N-acetyl-beta-D-mannosaminyltransferase